MRRNLVLKAGHFGFLVATQFGWQTLTKNQRTRYFSAEDKIRIASIFVLLKNKINLC